MKTLSIEEKAKCYDEALERALKVCNSDFEPNDKSILCSIIFPELKESEDEKIRKELIAHCKNTRCVTKEGAEKISKWITWLEKQGEPEDKGEISDGYHTFNELYRYRMLYNAAFFNLLPKELVHKSKRHHNGEECFGGGWFIVMANLPTGQISNHYELKDWDLFQIPERDVADEWDGHTPQEAADRLYKYLLGEQGEKKKSGGHKWKFEVSDWIIVPGEAIYQIKVIQDTNVTLVETNGDESTFDISILDEAKLWRINNAKDGDVLVASDESIFIYAGSTNRYAKFYVALTNCGTLNFKGGNWEDKNTVHPSTKKQRDLLFQKMKEAGYEWDAEKKELSKQTLNIMCYRI